MTRTLAVFAAFAVRRIPMEIGPIRRILKVEPEPYPYQHPENVPEEPSPRRVPKEEPLVPA